jgi:hypothetical protein
MSAPTDSDPRDDRAEAGGIGPYLAVVVVALVIAFAVAVYVAGYRDEIVAILTQSPT